MVDPSEHKIECKIHGFITKWKRQEWQWEQALIQEQNKGFYRLKEFLQAML